MDYKKKYLKYKKKYVNSKNLIKNKIINEIKNNTDVKNKLKGGMSGDVIAYIVTAVLGVLGVGTTGYFVYNKLFKKEEEEEGVLAPPPAPDAPALVEYLKKSKPEVDSKPALEPEAQVEVLPKKEQFEDAKDLEVLVGKDHVVFEGVNEEDSQLMRVHSANTELRNIGGTGNRVVSTVPMSLGLKVAVQILKEKVQELPDDEWKELGRIMEAEKLRRYYEKNPKEKMRKECAELEEKEWEKGGRKGAPPGQYPWCN